MRMHIYQEELMYIGFGALIVIILLLVIFVL
jgi:hypothetical protein